MLHQIEEPCSLGAHAGVIVPPSWIIKVRKPQVRNSPSLQLIKFTRCHPVTMMQSDLVGAKFEKRPVGGWWV